jgi:hypothetical protein
MVVVEGGLSQGRDGCGWKCLRAQVVNTTTSDGPFSLITSIRKLQYIAVVFFAVEPVHCSLRFLAYCNLEVLLVKKEHLQTA